MKLNDQQLLEEAYQQILEAEIPSQQTAPQASPTPQQQPSPVDPNKEKHTKALVHWSQTLRTTPPNPNVLQSLQTVLVQLSRESQDPIKQKATELSRFLSQTLPNIQGPQGRAALMFTTQKLSKEIEDLKNLALKS